MPAYTFFYDGPLEVGTQVALSPEEAHHLEHVMRLKIDDEIDLINGRGGLFGARVIAERKKCLVELLTHKQQVAPSGHVLEIVQGMPGLNKSDLIVEKLTELGVTHLTFFGAERSVRQTLGPSQLAKLQMKMVQACKQSGRLWLPTLRWIDRLQAWQAPAVASSHHQLLLLDPQGASLASEDLKITSSVSAFIGPESGLSEAEIAQIKKWKAQSISIHENILRSETASLAAATLLHFLQTPGL